MTAFRIWVDDVRPAPVDYTWVRTVSEACDLLRACRALHVPIEVLDLDHDAGDFHWDGGDYIRILDLMEEQGFNDIPIHIHSMNPVGVANMRAIIRKNNWREI